MKERERERGREVRILSVLARGGRWLWFGFECNIRKVIFILVNGCLHIVHIQSARLSFQLSKLGPPPPQPPKSSIEVTSSNGNDIEAKRSDTSILGVFLVSKRNELTYSRMWKDRSEANIIIIIPLQDRSNNEYNQSRIC
jgi:hypothetical protein